MPPVLGSLGYVPALWVGPGRQNRSVVVVALTVLQVQEASQKPN